MESWGATTTTEEASAHVRELATTPWSSSRFRGVPEREGGRGKHAPGEEELAAGSSSLLLPDATGHPQLELLPGAAGEEECHVAVDDEAVEAVPHLLVAVPDAPGSALPRQLPPVPTHLQAVAEVPCLALFTHEPQESHVYW